MPVWLDCSEKRKIQVAADAALGRLSSGKICDSDELLGQHHGIDGVNNPVIGRHIA
jgi:hypothetical protein